MTAYADVTLTGNLDHVTDAQLAAIDLLASLFAGGPDWRVTVEVDPGTVIFATPPRPYEADASPQPSEAPLSDERDPSAHAEAPNPGNGPTA